MKRLALSAIVLVMLMLGVTSAEANGGGDGGAAVTTDPVSFVLASAACPFLPAGTTVTGSGTETSKTWQKTRRDGATTITNVTRARGTATDQAGNVYVFDYKNRFRISDTAATPGVFSGPMFDAFSLLGKGPARLRNGFVADLTTSDFVSYSWNVRWSKGDPISFATGAVVAHCDPL
jgi:hypothetical protein